MFICLHHHQLIGGAPRRNICEIAFAAFPFLVVALLPHGGTLDPELRSVSYVI
jgi:hypothetical protein